MGTLRPWAAFTTLRPRRRPVLLTVAALALAVAAGIVLPPMRGPAPMLAVATAGELEQIYATRGFSTLAAGEGAAVPRILLAVLPGDLGAAEPAARKALFLRAMLPLVLTANEEIAADRAQLRAVADQVAAGLPLTGEQNYWLAALAERYGVGDGALLARPEDLARRLPQLLPELLRRVDAVPPSLAVAQAALESGWGTSRLALEGNALFGERTWSEPGLAPLAPAPGATHRARSFERLLDAVHAYMANLNTHPAYAAFRRARQATADGLALASHLTRYSERGSAYTRAVRDLIRSNHLQALDRAALEPATRST